jgi:hypothetical protein
MVIALPSINDHAQQAMHSNNQPQDCSSSTMPLKPADSAAFSAWQSRQKEQ